MFKSHFKDAAESVCLFALVAFMGVVVVGRYALDVCEMLSLEPFSLGGGALFLSMMGGFVGYCKFKG